MNDMLTNENTQIDLKTARIPKTASQMIGWRSTDPTCQLEKYGRYSKGRQTITKSLKWPNEGVL